MKGTKTAQGFIPHLWHSEHKVHMPVRLVPRVERPGALWEPEVHRASGRNYLVYALPGGGRYISTITI